MKQLSSEAQALIEQTRRLDEPTLGDRVRLRGRLDTSWAATTTATTSTTAPQLGMSLLQGKLLLSATSFVAVAGAGLLLATSSPAPAVQPATRSVDSPLTAARASNAERLPEQNLDSQGPFAPEPEPALVLAPSARAFTPTPTPAGARPASSAKAFALTNASSATPAWARARLAKPQRSPASRRLSNTSAQAERRDDLTSAGETPEARSSEQQALSSQHKPVYAEASGENGPVRSVDEQREASVPDAIGDEVMLLGAAERALRAGQPSRALGYIKQHALRFPLGALEQERAAVQALALCALNRKTAARLVFDDLARRAPSAAVLARIRHDCDF